LAQSPVQWHWIHIRGHQDTQATGELDQWAKLNIEMDTQAKVWHQCLTNAKYQPTLCSIPKEGWQLWTVKVKLTSFSQEKFNLIVQKRYSQEYWAQATKLGNIFKLIDWQACGDYCHIVSILRKIWMTKWVTGWLPIAKNMKRWGMWTTANCPECDSSMEDTGHILQCLAPVQNQLLNEKIISMERNLLERRLSPTAVSVLLSILYPCHYMHALQRPPEVSDIQKLQQLGNHSMAWGFLSTNWKQHLY